MTNIFRYAATMDGRRTRGVVTAKSEAEAAALLQRSGLTPLSLSPGRRPTRARAGLDDRAGAMRRLASLVEARAPLDRALRLSGGSDRAGPLFDDLALAVAGGRSLSAALADWPADFSEAETALIASGEAAGALPRSLDAAASMLERRSSGRRAVVSALAYPAFVLAAALAALAIFVGFAQPRFEAVLRAANAEVSTTTEAFFAVSAVVRDWGGPALLICLAALAAAVLLSGSAAGKRAVTSAALGLPLVGPVLRDRALEAYCGALGAMLVGGAPLPEAARLAAPMLGPPRLTEAGAGAAQAVAEGRGFAVALREAGVFPPELPAFAEIGEETGGLGPLMDRAARHFGQEAETRARRLSAVAAPAATLMLGLLIGVGAYLMMTAVLDVYDAAL